MLQIPAGAQYIKLADSIDVLHAASAYQNDRSAVVLFQNMEKYISKDDSLYFQFLNYYYEVNYHNGLYDSAIAILDYLAVHDYTTRNNSTYFLDKARLLYITGRIDESIKLYERQCMEDLVEVDFEQPTQHLEPNSANFIMLCQLYLLKRNYKKAASWLNAANNSYLPHRYASFKSQICFGMKQMDSAAFFATVYDAQDDSYNDYLFQEYAGKLFAKIGDTVTSNYHEKRALEYATNMYNELLRNKKYTHTQFYNAWLYKKQEEDMLRIINSASK